MLPLLRAAYPGNELASRRRAKKFLGFTLTQAKNSSWGLQLQLSNPNIRADRTDPPNNVGILGYGLIPRLYAQQGKRSYVMDKSGRNAKPHRL